MNLYEIDTRLQEAFDKAIDKDTGEIIDDEAYESFKELDMAWDAKVENIALWIKELDAEAEAIAAEEKRFAKRRGYKENKAKRLREYLSEALAGKKFETARVQVSYRTSKFVDITDASALPEDVFSAPASVPSKSAIKELLDSGQEVPGARLAERKSIQIK